MILEFGGNAQLFPHTDLITDYMFSFVRVPVS
jgi:hypothetical protein